LGAKLPVMTQVVLGLSQATAHHLVLVVLVYGAVVLGCVRLFPRHGQVIAIAAILHGALLIALAVLVLPAIFYPIIELQKSLS
ncbi:MAG TPA: hypothetical protein VEL07_02760, partial [Planctomycetota bacterium]|nr:hypothetical protein [Planctomycetota bacterium]